MAMKPTEFDGAVPVDGYGPGFFRVGGEVLHGPVLVQAGGVQPWSGLEDHGLLLALAGKIDVLFLGRVQRLPTPPPLLHRHWRRRGSCWKPWPHPLRRAPIT